jgi:hypothetical protein
MMQPKPSFPILYLAVRLILLAFHGFPYCEVSVLMDLSDKLMLRKRAIIESVNDFLKNICQIEHSRHRAPINFLVNLISGLVAYSFLPSRPSLALQPPLLLLC